jgi:hypothetical protein
MGDYSEVIALPFPLFVSSIAARRDRQRSLENHASSDSLQAAILRVRYAPVRQTKCACKAESFAVCASNTGVQPETGVRWYVAVNLLRDPAESALFSLRHARRNRAHGKSTMGSNA